MLVKGMDVLSFFGNIVAQIPDVNMRCFRQRRPYSYNDGNSQRKEGIYMLNENIKLLRKARGLSQEELAFKLKVVRQTVSKWERGLCYPDMELLPAIADLFGTTTDLLLCHTPGELHRTQYGEFYKSDDYYWGIEPTPFCYRVLEQYPPNRYLHLL